jgi:hypothetical protein
MEARMGSRREAAAAAMGEGADLALSHAAENFGLPDDLAAALRRLETMPAPRKLQQPANWRSVVADAMVLARDRWAAKAMALGWTVGDLFGVGAKTDWDFQGLAVWLGGRRIIMLDEKQAIVVGDSGDFRAAFVRGGMRHGTHPVAPSVMLWNFGR